MVNVKTKWKMFIVAEKLSRLFIYMENWCPNKNILREIIMQMSGSIFGSERCFHILFCKFAKIVPRLDFIIDFQIILRQICINFLKTRIKSNENTGPRLPYLKLCILCLSKSLVRNGGFFLSIFSPICIKTFMVF